MRMYAESMRHSCIGKSAGKLVGIVDWHRLIIARGPDETRTGVWINPIG
jgi:hypothetical protein